MRKLRLGVLYVARALGLFALARVWTAQAVRILCYHGAWLGDARFSGDAMFIRPATFAARLETIRELGYQPVTLSDAIDGLNGAKPLPRNAVVVTIDDGWYSTYVAMMPAIQTNAIPVTLYCDTGHLLSATSVPQVKACYAYQIAGAPKLDAVAQGHYDRATDPGLPIDERKRGLAAFATAVGIDLAPLTEGRIFDYMTAPEIKELFETGLVDVQLHTHNHTLHDMSPAAVEKEIALNRQELSRLLDVPESHFKHFCYPSGATSASVVATVERLGIASSTTVADGLAFPHTHRQLLPRIIDGDHLYPIEFEAEMAGFLHYARKLIGFKSMAVRLLPNVPAPNYRRAMMQAGLVLLA